MAEEFPEGQEAKEERRTINVDGVEVTLFVRDDKFSK
ncbi:hypothetical protein LROSRS0_0387 [Furfurilactobacillus rossiae]|jgi:hypothetical protein|nr:hypothetical protein LROSRS0_0387 [Furfurilactobacillus rossiae]QLE63203.1 hypothetical protein LROSL1_0383 [Furfurilactobacillus rossiae]QLE65656.1 hypothetical protein LROSL2_0303 [Furfurilactobacillus rossiae]QLE68086.1 hypothetical protein LROSL3_0304 [Furfurilactobacillus rossiae]